MLILVSAFVVRTCVLYKALIRLRVWLACLGFCCTYMNTTEGADQTARMHMLVCAFVLRTCILHKVLIRLSGCACLSGLLLYVHICYIRR